MDYQAKIVEGLTGDPDVQQRRADLLRDFLAALDRGGVEDATAVLSRPFAEIDQVFTAELAELQRLL